MDGFDKNSNGTFKAAFLLHVCRIFFRSLFIKLVHLDALFGLFENLGRYAKKIATDIKCGVLLFYQPITL